MAPDGDPAAALLRPGTLLAGRYEIKRAIGVGGMGAVYEAMHVRLHRPAAIKVLLPEYAATAEFQARFEREARAAAALKSPHVVRVYDVDTSAEGHAFIVMELLDGNDLGQEADRRDIPIPELVDWIAQACMGLEEAHKQGIVHRDLKPVNIFLANSADGARVAKLLDFGISRITHEPTQITRPNDGVLGTPRFMAPEQIRGKAVDHRADIWAMGVVLYHLLTRDWPFTGENDHAYLGAVVSEVPFAVLERRPDLPPGLAAAVMSALKRRPEDRMQTARDFALAIAPFGAGNAMTATGPTAAPSDPQIWGSVPPPAMSSGRDRVVVDPLAQDTTDTVIHAPTPMRALTSRVAGPSPMLPIVLAGLALVTVLGLTAAMVMVARRPVAAAGAAPPSESATPPKATPRAEAAEPTATTPGTSSVAPRPPPTGVANESASSPAPSASSTGSPTGRPPTRPRATAAPSARPPATSPSADLPRFL